MVYSSILINDYDLLRDYFIWKYSVCMSRNINVDCFLVEYEFWKESVSNHLYPSHRSEINMIYDYLILNHEDLKNKAINTKNIKIDSKYQDLFDELLTCLLKGQKNEFYTLNPDLVVLSVTLSSNVATLQQIVKELKKDSNLFSGKIIIGGQGLFSEDKIINIKEADFCSRNLEELKEFLILHNPIKS